MRLVLASAGLLLASLTLVAGPPMAKVTIHVTSAENGKPVDRASVVVKFVHGRSPVKLYRKMLTTWETQTNQEGKSTLPEIPQGTIRVQVIAKNFQTFGEIVEVADPESTVEVKLNPPQPQYSVK